MINRESLWDSNLPLDTIGLFTRLLSRPNDWKFRVNELSKSCGCGKDKIYRMLNELIENGYCYRHQPKTEIGRYDTTEYLIFETKEQCENFKKSLPQRCFPEAEVPRTELAQPISPMKNDPLLSIDLTKSSSLNRDSEQQQQEEVVVLDDQGSKERDLEYKMPSGEKKKISCSDIFRNLLSQNFTTEQILQAIDIARESEFIRDPIRFIEGIIKTKMLNNSFKKTLKPTSHKLEGLKFTGEKQCIVRTPERFSINSENDTEKLVWQN